MARRKANRAETIWAQAFVKAMGSSQYKDPYLLQVIVTWIRLEGGLGKMRGNNPLNIRLSPFASGYVWDSTHKFKVAKFSSMAQAVKAYAWYFKSGTTSFSTDPNPGVSNPKEAWAVFMRSVRRKVGTTAQAQQRAKELLVAIGTIGWNGKTYFNHYGFSQNSGGRLFEVYNSIGGVTFPPIYTKTPGVRKTREIPPPPRPLLPPAPQRIYMDPYAPKGFLNARSHIYSYNMSGLIPLSLVD